MPGFDDEAQYQIRALARDLRRTKARINRLHGTCGVSPDAAGCLEQSGGRRRKRTKKKTRRRRHKKHKKRKKRRKSRKRKAGASSTRRNINNINVVGKTAAVNEIVNIVPQQGNTGLFDHEVEVAGYSAPFNRGTVVDFLNHETVIVEMQYPNDEGEITVSINDITPLNL